MCSLRSLGRAFWWFQKTEVIPINLLGLSKESLIGLTAAMGQPAYRAAQLMDWLYSKGTPDLQAMTDLPRSLRENLISGGYTVELPQENTRFQAPDGTVKFLFTLSDGQQVETVYIPEGPRHTICLSTQVGCGMGCLICATGRTGLVRNLQAGEIIGQVLKVQKLVSVRITNVVIMGQGEPLANYEATVTALNLCGADHGMGIAARHLALSTCGLPGGIVRLAEEGRQWRLTVSLHAACNELRDKLMPINRRYPLQVLKKACADYCNISGRRITFAYVLISGVNDRAAEARAVAGFCEGLSAHINLIPWNMVPGVDLAPPGGEKVALFRQWLEDAGVNATIRRPRGAEFNAACGQLRADLLEAGK